MGINLSALEVQTTWDPVPERGMRTVFKGTQGRALNMHTWTYIPLGKLISLSLLFHQKDGEGSPSGGQGVWGPRNELRPPVSAALADPDHSAPLRSSPGNTSYSRRQRRPLPHLPLKQLFYFWLTLFWANPPESSCLKGNCSWQISCFFLCAAVVIQSLSHHPLTGIFIAWLFSLLLLWFCVVWFS